MEKVLDQRMMNSMCQPFNVVVDQYKMRRDQRLEQVRNGSRANRNDHPDSQRCPFSCFQILSVFCTTTTPNPNPSSYSYSYSKSKSKSTFDSSHTQANSQTTSCSESRSYSFYSFANSSNILWIGFRDGDACAW